MSESETVTVLVDGKEFTGWSTVELTDQLDSISTAEFTAPFEPTRREFREVFRPFTYKTVEAKLNGVRFFSGRMVGINPQSDAGKREVSITAYAHAGWLHDVTAPGSKYPVEFKKSGLGVIAGALGEPFGVTVQIRGSEGSKFKRARLEEDKKILAFLTELAQQRNLVWSNTPDGMLLGWRSVAPGNPVAHLKGDESPLTKISAEFSPQDYYSEITCFSKTSRRRRGNQYTEKNKFLTGILRPLAFRAQDTEPAEAPVAAKAKLGRMLANMVSFTIDDLPTWRDPAGNVWTPNTTLFVTAPDVMIYKKTELLIRAVSLRQEKDKLTASLNVVLPGSFSGEAPERLPWQE